MRLTFYGGAGSVTGANYLLETDKAKILIDCGLVQGGHHVEEENQKPFPYNASKVDAVFITHAHLDHTGRLPKLCKEGFRGDVYATHPTLGLARIILDDSLGIMKNEARYEGRKMLYQKRDLIECWKRSHGRSYGEEIKEVPGIRVVFRDAGHILGSSIVEVYIDEGGEEKKIIFSGDLGNPPVPFLRETEKIEGADYVLTESTYGDRLHEDHTQRKEKLEEIIESTIKSGGTLMIPSFAVERSQEILFELNSLVENNLIPRIPIFLDSPMAIKATAVYQEYTDYFNEKATDLILSGDDLFDFPGLEFTLSTEASKRINNINPPKIIIAGSGMSTGGRILHHEKLYLPDPKSTLLFIGYQVHGTLGRRLYDGAKKVKIFGDEVQVNSRIEAIGGYSAHADQRGLIDWLRGFKQKPKKIFMVQGEEKPSSVLADKVRSELGLETEVPKKDQVVEL